MMVRMKENKIKTNNEKSGQLELGFSGRPQQQNFQRHTGRVARAAWWFARMREAVEEAIEWPAAHPPRAEQIWLRGANREVKI
jgi:hypothetical protein